MLFLNRKKNISSDFERGAGRMLGKLGSWGVREEAGNEEGQAAAPRRPL